MMTTSRVFGIAPPDSNTNTFNQQQITPPVKDDSAEKFQLLAEAVKKFLNKEITKAEFETIQKALNPEE